MGGLGLWDTAAVPPGGGTSGGGTTADPPGGGTGGRSGEECERQYCPMCGDDEIDLLGVSVDSQCTKCRSLNAANIRACVEGRAAGPAVVTQSTYRLVQGPGGLKVCLEPSDVKGPNDIVISVHRSWDECYERSHLFTGR